MDFFQFHLYRFYFYKNLQFTYYFTFIVKFDVFIPLTRLNTYLNKLSFANFSPEKVRN